MTHSQCRRSCCPQQGCLSHVTLLPTHHQTPGPLVSSCTFRTQPVRLPLQPTAHAFPSPAFLWCCGNVSTSTRPDALLAWCQSQLGFACPLTAAGSSELVFSARNGHQWATLSTGALTAEYAQLGKSRLPLAHRLLSSPERARDASASGGEPSTARGLSWPHVLLPHATCNYTCHYTSKLHLSA